LVFEHVGVVVGLEAEARIARRLGCNVAVGGGGEAGARAAAARLIDGGARALVSFGLAGGLDPVLAPGALVVPDVVLCPDGHWPTDPALAAGLGRVGGALWSAGEVVVTVAAKAALYGRTGAAAVDLESAAVAEAASRHALPFAVLRAICDSAARSLPQAALVALDSEGRIGPWRVATAALSHATELPALLALAGDAMRARRALSVRVATIKRLGTLSEYSV
jgi:adenosylhomocysteine nucleosidase